MDGTREGVSQRVAEAMASGGSLVILGEHGSGRTRLLDEVDRARPVRRTTGLRLDASDGTDALADALRHPVSRCTSPDEVVSRLGGAALLVDDAQWIGAEGRRLIGELIGRATLLVSVAAEEPDATDVVDHLVDRGAQVVELAPLDAAAASDHLRARGLSGTALSAVLAKAGGNLGLLDAGARSLSPCTAAGLRARALSLDAHERDAIALLHLAGGRMPRDLVESSDLARAVAAGWLTLDADGVVLRQGHLGEAVVAGLSAQEVLGAHRVLAANLEAGRAALHLELAGSPAAAADHAARAARTASAAERPDLLALVLRCAPDLDDARRGPLDREYAEALLDAGRTEEAIEVATRCGAHVIAAAGLRQIGRPGEAERVLGDGPPSSSQLQDDLELASLEVARLAWWPGVGPATADTGPDGSGWWVGSEPTSNGGRDLSAVRELGARCSPDQARAVAIRLAADERWDEAVTVAVAVIAHLALGGQLDAAASAAAQWGEVVRSAPDGPWTASSAVALGVVELHRGAPTAEVQEALGPLIGCGHPLPGVVAGHLAVALADAGGANEALGLLEEVWAGGRPRGRDAALLTWAHAEVELVAGRPRRAMRALDEHLDAEGRAGRWAVAGGLGLVASGWAAFAVADPPPDPGPVGGAVEAELRGLELLHRAGADRAAAGAAADAAAQFDEAARRWRSARAVRRARWAAAEARRRHGDTDQAVDELRALEAEALELGLLPFLTQVRQSLRRSGIQMRARRVTPSPLAPAASAGPAGLSPRETQVMALVAEGLASGGIADRLGVARATVETQITSAMRKLGARTRVQAAVRFRQETVSP